MRHRSFWPIVTATLVSLTLLNSCSLVRFSGTMTRKTGEAMTGMSEGREDSIFGKLLGFGGRVNTSIGSTVEGMAGGGKKEDEARTSKTSEDRQASRPVAPSAVAGGTSDDGAAQAREEEEEEEEEKPSSPAASTVPSPSSDATTKAQPEVSGRLAAKTDKNTPLAARKAKSGKEQTRRAQERLKASGYDPGPIDGVNGQKMKAALKKYQKDRRLKLTGNLDAATTVALGI